MANEKYRVLIDTDPGLGSMAADVDDGLALFIMLNNPEVFKIEGITTVFGNTPVKKGNLLLKQYLELSSRKDIPHFVGASSKYSLGKLTDASSFLIEEVKENPKKLTLITLGPLTNIATALEHYSEFFENLKQLIFMGGTVEPSSAFNSQFVFNNGLSEKMEFNFYSDPNATKRVVETETFTNRIGMGLDICCQAVFKREHLKKIESVSNPIAKYLVVNIKNWLSIWELNKSNGFFPYDVFVPIYLLKPEMFTSVELFLEVDTESFPGKVSIMDLKRENSAPITYCMNFSNPDGEEEFMDILISNLIKLI